jgi:tetratricopeptide (TPR) repeat protein
MKKCLNCNTQVDDKAHVCPKCGGSTLMGSYSAADALAMLDGLKDMGKAREHVDRSAQLFQAGRYPEAIAELQAAIKVNPMNAVAHGNMGCVLLKQGKTSEAIPWLEKALQLDPNIEGVPAELAQAKASSQPRKSGGFFSRLFGG